MNVRLPKCLAQWRLSLWPGYDVDDVLGASGLPADLADDIRDLVAQAKLTRMERVDVTEELVSHFGEGLDAGRSAAQLSAAFGSSELVAGLMHRAKVRQRGLVHQAMRYSGVVAGLLLVVYATLTVRTFVGRPTITTDFQAELAAPALAVTEENRAWPEYRQILLRMTGRDDNTNIPRHESPFPGNPGFERQASWHAANRHLLPELRRAAALPGLGFVPAFEIEPADQPLWPDEPIGLGEGLWERSMVSVRLPYLMEVRRLGQLLKIDLALALDSGNDKRAIADLAASAGLARQIREVQTLINDLVALSVVAGALDTQIAHLQRGGSLSAGALAELTAMDDLMDVRLEGERLWFHDFLQRAYTNDGSGDGRLTFEGQRVLDDPGVLSRAVNGNASLSNRVAFAAARPVMGLVELSRREIAVVYDELLDTLISEGEKPPWEADLNRVDVQIERWHGDPLARRKYGPIVVFMPAVANAVSQGWGVAVRRDALLVADAIERYRGTHGTLPESLDAIEADWAGEMPRDLFNGERIQYLVEINGYSLYSVGSDRIDQGGGGPVEPAAPRLGQGNNDDWTILRWLDPAATDGL